MPTDQRVDKACNGLERLFGERRDIDGELQAMQVGDDVIEDPAGIDGGRGSGQEIHHRALRQGAVHAADDVLAERIEAERMAHEVG